MGKNILIVAATDLELKPLLSNMKFETISGSNMKRATLENNKIDILITTIGMVATTHKLTRTLCSHKYDYVINAGICGAFNTSFQLGDVVNVVNEVFAELAVDGNDGLSPIKLGASLGDEMLTISIHNENPISTPSLQNLKKVKGVTVNTISGNKKRIDYFRKMYAPDVESMEGAAFLYVCNAMNQPCTQIRSISNHIGNPDRNDWNIELAVNNLAKVILRIINELEKIN